MVKRVKPTSHWTRGPGAVVRWPTSAIWTFCWVSFPSLSAVIPAEAKFCGLSVQRCTPSFGSYHSCHVRLDDHGRVGSDKGQGSVMNAIFKWASSQFITLDALNQHLPSPLRGCHRANDFPTCTAPKAAEVTAEKCNAVTQRKLKNPRILHFSCLYCAYFGHHTVLV